MFNKKSITTQNESVVNSNTSEKPIISLVDDEVEKEAFFNDITNKNISKIKDKLKTPSFQVWKLTDENENTVLHRACFFSSFELVEALISSLKLNLGIQFDKFFNHYVNARNREGNTALHYASYVGNIQIIRFLLEYDADINACNNRGLNVLHFAAQGNQPNSLVYFKEKYRLNIDCFDECGSRPIHWSCYSGSYEVAEFLIGWNADVNVKDNEGNTPLHLSIINDDRKIVRLLLQHRGDPMIKNNKGQSCIELARFKHKKEILRILEYKKRFGFFEVKYPFSKLKKKKKTNKVAIYIIVNVIVGLFMTFNLFYSFHEVEYKNKIIAIFLGNFIIYNLLYTILYFYNPGIKKSKEEVHQSFLDLIENGIDISNYCPKCQRKKEYGSFHCIICKKCVMNYRHHCFWTNNCIGSKNYFYFILFIFFLTIFTILTPAFSVWCFLLKNGSTVQWCDSIFGSFCDPLKSTLCVLCGLVGLILAIPMVIYCVIYIRKITKKKKVNVSKIPRTKLVNDTNIHNNMDVSLISGSYQDFK